MLPNQPTREFYDFERKAIDPDVLSMEDLLAAFRAGNRVVAVTLMNEGPGGRQLQGMEESVNILGEALRQRWPAERKKETPTP